MEKNRVELHIHLEGAIRHETIHELMTKRKMALPGDGSLGDLTRALTIAEPKDLAHFLSPFGVFAHVLREAEVAERVAFELCAEAAANGVLYAEARYSPHNFLPAGQAECSRATALERVVRAVGRGFERGEAAFGVRARSVLCSLNGEETAGEVLALCRTLRGEGVVGLDTATKQCLGYNPEEVALDPRLVGVYEEARKCGVHRTVHAGESGGPDMVARALDVYRAERIGHGYRAVEDEALFGRCVAERVHFECCPRSSTLTGAVKLDGHEKHPIVRFAERGANFSVSSDDPTITGHWLDGDYQLLETWGLGRADFRRANLNAAEACFLPEHEKKELISTVKRLWK